MYFYFLVFLIGFTAIVRIVELRIANINKQNRLTQENTIEVSEKYFFLFVLLHSSFLVFVPLEVFLFKREFIPLLGYSCLLLFTICFLLRIHVLRILKSSWNTKILYSHSADSIVTTGIYSYIRHPNYLIVILEIALLSLFHSAYICFVLFSVLNAILLSFRIPLEEEYLMKNEHYKKHFQDKNRFIPRVF
jgi:methyltransferase